MYCTMMKSTAAAAARAVAGFARYRRPSLITALAFITSGDSACGSAAAFHAEASRKRPPHVGVINMSPTAAAGGSAPSSEQGGPLETLCKATLEACEALTPTISSLYESINSSDSKKGAKTKADNSAFTIADGLVQHLLIEELLDGVVGNIVGEEECVVNLNTEPYTVDDLEIPAELIDLIEEAKSQVANAKKRHLGSRSAQGDTYQTLTAFLDPIDGTREFSTGMGEQCSICVGFSDASGMPVAGVVFRPLSNPHPTWAMGAEGYTASRLNLASEEERGRAGLLTSNGSISPFIEELMRELDCPRTPSGGAGNKMLMLLEGHGQAYIQDRGVSRWDTAAAQAVIEAHGGILCKLSIMLNDEGKEESYAYLRSSTNVDFVANEATLTKYNAAAGVGDVSEAIRMAMNAAEVKPYANLCGLFAIGADENTKTRKADLLAAIKRAAKFSPPSFD